MVRKFETYTFSSSKFFSDRGPGNGCAQPITEHVNVSHCMLRLQQTSLPEFQASFSPYSIILFP